MANRKYLITFCTGTKYENTYIEQSGNSKDDVLSEAFAKFGVMNVSSVYADNTYNRNLMKAKGFHLVHTKD